MDNLATKENRMKTSNKNKYLVSIFFNPKKIQIVLAGSHSIVGWVLEKCKKNNKVEKKAVCIKREEKKKKCDGIYS